MSYRILIVDASATARAVAKRAIRGTPFGGAGPAGGAKIREAATAAEAMDVLHHHRADLVLVDPHLPDRDGADLVGQILAEPDTRGTPVVLMSARAPDPRALAALRRAGVRGHLPKPFTPAMFAAAVRDILEPTHV